MYLYLPHRNANNDAAAAVVVVVVAVVVAVVEIRVGCNINR